MAVEALLISQFVAATAMLLLAAWLLWLNFRSTVNRAFAVFLVLRACVILANRMRAFAEASGDAPDQLFWQTIREYYYLALAPAILYFWVAYSGLRRRVPWRVAIVLAAVVLEGLYMADHCLDYCRGSSGLLHLGPLALFGNPAYLLALGAVGLWVLHDALRPAQTPHAKAAFPVAIGLLLAALLEAAIQGGVLWRVGAEVILADFDPSPWRGLFHIVLLLAAVPPLVGLAWSLGAAAQRRDLRGKARVFAALAILTTASGLYVGWNVVQGAEWLPGIFLVGLWRILLPALVAYALVRHRLFGIEIRLKWTLVRATMAVVFLAVFFMAAQLAQNYLSVRYGWGLGGLAAGLLLFAISPIQRAAERFTQAVLPHTRPVATMAHPERLDLFRHQAMLVWSDGAMGRKERALLDGLRDRLAIPHQDAARIEAEAAAIQPGAAVAARLSSI